MTANLVIVESPAKAKTIERYLGPGYTVLASYGHVRDLPENPGKGQLGVDVEHDFAPDYEIPTDRRRQVSAIEKAGRGADHIFLATDLDREGEAIAWHVAEAAHLPADRTSRVTFSEITEPAIRAAFAAPRSINGDLVDAQQTRRIVDRLVGYTLSPLISRKVRSGLSAGRVQSVAVRLVVEREREIRAFAGRRVLDDRGFAPGAGRHALRGGARADRRAQAGHLGRRDRAPPRRGAPRQPARGPRRHGQDVEAQSRSAVHHVDPPAGGEPQARLQPEADHVGRPASVRGRGDAGRAGRAHHLHADGLGGALRPGARRGAHGDRRAVRAGVRRGEGSALPDHVPERAGGPRGDPPDLARPRAGRARRIARARRGAALPVDLAAHPGQPDDREAARDDHGRPGRRRVRPSRVGDADAVRRLQPGLHGGPRRGRGGGRADAPASRRGRCRDGHRRRAHAALHRAAAALHRGVAREGARGARRGTPVHLRGHALHDRGSRLCHDPRAAALPGAGRRGRHRPPRGAFRAVRGPRVHRPDGGRARRDRARRARLGAAPPGVLRAAPNARRREAQGAEAAGTSPPSRPTSCAPRATRW